MDVEAEALDSPRPRAAEHIRQYLATGGRRVDHPRADRLILLYTRGRKSGRIHRTPLVHVAGGGDRYVAASAAGRPSDPAWYRNLRADPRVWVRDRDEFFPATATALEGDERDAMWEEFVGLMPNFAEYQATVDRVIPVVRLRRAD